MPATVSATRQDLEKAIPGFSLQELNSLSDLPDGMIALVIPDNTGDYKCMWDPNDPTQCEQARQTFDFYKKKGYTAYKVKGDGEKGEIVTNFDIQAGRAIYALVKPLAGG